MRCDGQMQHSMYRIDITEIEPNGGFTALISITRGRLRSRVYPGVRATPTRRLRPRAAQHPGPTPGREDGVVRSVRRRPVPAASCEVPWSIDRTGVPGLPKGAGHPRVVGVRRFRWGAFGHRANRLGDHHARGDVPGVHRARRRSLSDVPLELSDPVVRCRSDATCNETSPGREVDVYMVETGVLPTPCDRIGGRGELAATPRYVRVVTDSRHRLTSAEKWVSDDQRGW